MEDKKKDPAVSKIEDKGKNPAVPKIEDNEQDPVVSAEYLYLYHGMSAIAAQLQSLMVEIANMQMRAEDIYISGPESTQEAPRMVG